ncbi:MULTISPECIES: hypothetical protein [Pyrobaculum]|uniref:Uncharacterized protein n=1 Tax=Pyrobaculum arsenaticum TaxID=121277 RepID=A0A7L4P8E2_9CREN|nr:hypothetical protein [Pyrobaculum arsenaticum]MCY0891728.1 hypothetical protein [Pyrobaculum arsenaticum]NYR15238.1 hypothetical protein [Pyrobaculum arsenaticum]
MTDDLLQIVAITVFSILVLTLFLLIFPYVSTPAVCQATRLVLENPGSEIIVYGRFRVSNDTYFVYFSCGLQIPKEKIQVIYKTEGKLVIGTTADGFLYVR